MKRTTVILILLNFFLTAGAQLSDAGKITAGKISLQQIQAIPFDSSSLPIVYIRTNGQAIVNEPKITADMGIIDHGYNQINHVTDTPNDFVGKIGIEIRGSISQLWAQKSYGFETRDSSGNNLDVSLLGMPDDNDWILYSPYDDKTLMRNVMTYEIARQMGYWAPRTKFVELVIDVSGTPEYQGVYVLMEKIKRGNSRVDIAKLDSTENTGDDVTGGYIFAIDRNIWTGDSGFVSSNPQNIFFAYKYPEGDKITQAQKDYLKNYIDSFENALAAPNFDDPVNGFRKYAEEFSFMDFFFITEMSKNIDAYKRSAYLYKNKYSIDGRLHAGPVWDYNSAWYNIHYCGFDYFFGWAYPMTCWISSAPVPFWWERFLEDTTYANAQKCRWTDWRNSVLDTTNFFHIIDSVADYIRPAAAREFANYSFTETFQGQVDTLKGWIYYRLAWMDANMPGNCIPLSVNDQDLSQQNFSLSPNPTGEFSYLHFDLTTEKQLRIVVYDINGRIVCRTDQQRFLKGTNTVRIDLKNLAEGIYNVNVISETNVTTLKLIKGSK